MKITRNINLHGVVLTMDEDAYQELKDYLADIENRLPEDEKTDVMDDLESRIAEVLQSELFARSAQVVTQMMIKNIENRIGAPSEFGENKRPTIKRERFNRQGLGRVLAIILKVILIIIAIQILAPVLAVLFGLLMAVFGLSLGGAALVPAIGFTLTGSAAWTWVLSLSLICAIVMPLVMIIHWIVKYARERKHPSLRFWVITLLLWFLSIGGLIASGIQILAANGQTLSSLLLLLNALD
jgi:hypothetical protein